MSILYDTLLNFRNHPRERESETWASGQGIYGCLLKIFEDTVHIIHPDLSLIDTPTCTTSLSGVVNYIDAIDNILKQDQRELQKPIISIWCTKSIPQEEIKDDFNSIGRNHWQTLVIIPKEYINIQNNLIRNQTEEVFFKDSYFTERYLPPIFSKLLSEKQRFRSGITDGAECEDEYLEIGGILKNVKYHDRSFSEVIQHTNISDSGWWAVCNAIMILVTGNDSFLGEFSEQTTSKNLGNKLRSIFYEFGLEMCAENLNIQFNLKHLQYSKDLANSLAADLLETIKLKLKTKANHKLVKSKLKHWSPHYLMILDSLIDNLPLNEAYQSTLDLYERDIGKSPSTFCDEQSCTTTFMNLEPILQDDNMKFKVRGNRVFALSISSFRYLIQETDVFVDKTMFIKRIFNHSSVRILITRPRRWGKTLNMQMIQEFLQPKADSNGILKIDDSICTNPLFQGGNITTSSGITKNLSPLKIAGEPEFVKRHMGKYPVIYITFRGSTTTDSFKHLNETSYLNCLRNPIKKAFKQHDYIYRLRLCLN